MKIFQIISALCWWDATATVHSLDEAKEMFPPDCLFVEAPDYVFEGWGYDEHEKGDARFIRPEVPDGYEYDEGTGTFAPVELRSMAKGAEMSDAEKLADLISRMTQMLEEAETLLASLNEEKEEQKEEKK